MLRSLPRLATFPATTLAVALLGVPSLCTPSTAQRQEQTRSPQTVLQQTLTAAWEAADAPGITAAVVLPDGTVLAATAGHEDAEKQIELKPSARMLSGSIGKTYVAALALQAIERGELAADDHVLDVLGEDSWAAKLPNAEQVQVTHLLHHTSGIPDHVWRPEFGAAVIADPDRVWSPEDRCSYIFDADPLFAAGKGWAYADTNYVVLGAMIERACGAPIEDLQRSRLLEPLGLEDTLPADRRELDGLVVGHCSGVVFLEGPNLDDDGRFRINPQVEWCGGGIASTASDLARWGRALLEGRPFAESTRAASLARLLDTVPTRSRRLPGEYGCGIHIRGSAHGPVQGHSGIMTGYLAELAHYPELDLTVALMWNTDDPRTTGSRPGLADEIAGRLAVTQSASDGSPAEAGSTGR